MKCCVVMVKRLESGRHRLVSSKCVIHGAMGSGVQLLLHDIRYKIIISNRVLLIHPDKCEN